MVKNTPVWLKGLSPFSLKRDAKLQSVNRFGLLLVLDPNIPHGGIKTFMTGEVFYSEGPHPFLMQPGAEGMPQKMGAMLNLIDTGQLQVSSHHTINISTVEIIPFGFYKEPAI
ncbi:unnamed protein product [marine sediment metagenome]|uniref:Uncharacterized protein n=1 Tax=marine sediment metagenome TaxID=412755 RepID=X1SR62_9ZZZZ